MGDLIAKIPNVNQVGGRGDHTEFLAQIHAIQECGRIFPCKEDKRFQNFLGENIGYSGEL